MSTSDLTIIVMMTIAALTIMNFWRKALMLMVSVAIAVFLYGLFDLTRVIST